ncbi:MAG: pyridoxamine 5'-phosphate oxidase family protein [Sphingomonadales bacterium]|nr:pyridoxamine 5'-phosphate oxidase family protein [Sphingomonadales bacterium]
MTELPSQPAYYDDLGLSFEEAWNLVEAGSTDRHGPAHTPTVGTVDETGAPQLRIMILRDASRDTRTLRFHTDLRSIKAAQVRNNGATSVLFYDMSAKLQIRMSGQTQLLPIGDVADAAWSNSTPFARRCYMAEAAPGLPIAGPSSGLPEWIQGKKPDEAQLADYRQNFSTMLVEIQSVEWLYLANPGHRRARWQWQDAQKSWQGTWLVP